MNFDGSVIAVAGLFLVAIPLVILAPGMSSIFMFLGRSSTAPRALPEAPTIIGLPSLVGLPILLPKRSPCVAPNLSNLSSTLVLLVLNFSTPFLFTVLIVVRLLPIYFSSVPFLIKPVLRVHPTAPSAFVAPRIDLIPVAPILAPFTAAPKPMVAPSIAASAATSPTTLPGSSLIRLPASSHDPSKLPSNKPLPNTPANVSSS